MFYMNISIFLYLPKNFVFYTLNTLCKILLSMYRKRHLNAKLIIKILFS